MNGSVATLKGLDNQNSQIVLRIYKETGPGSGRVYLDQLPHYFSPPHDIEDDYSILRDFKKYFAEIHRAFPDYELHIDKLIEKGDKVMVRYTITGTHENDYNGLTPTHERVTITGLDIFRLSGGKIAMHWNPATQVNIISRV